MIKKGRRCLPFSHFLKIPPNIERTMDLPRLRPIVVAVVLMVFSNALPAVDFFFLVLVLLELELFERSFSLATLALRFSSSSASFWRRFSSCFCCSTRSS